MCVCVYLCIQQSQEPTVDNDVYMNSNKIESMCLKIDGSFLTLN